MDPSREEGGGWKVTHLAYWLSVLGILEPFSSSLDIHTHTYTHIYTLTHTCARIHARTFHVPARIGARSLGCSPARVGLFIGRSRKGRGQQVGSLAADDGGIPEKGPERGVYQSAVGVSISGFCFLWSRVSDIWESDQVGVRSGGCRGKS